MLVAVTAEPLVLTLAFQELVIDWPEGQVQLTVQPLIGELPAVTVTLALKAPVQLEEMVMAALQPPGPPVGLEV